MRRAGRSVGKSAKRLKQWAGRHKGGLALTAATVGVPSVISGVIAGVQEANTAARDTAYLKAMQQPASVPEMIQSGGGEVMEAIRADMAVVEAEVAIVVVVVTPQLTMLRMVPLNNTKFVNQGNGRLNDLKRSQQQNDVKQPSQKQPRQKSILVKPLLRKGQNERPV